MTETEISAEKEKEMLLRRITNLEVENEKLRSETAELKEELKATKEGLN